MRRPTPREESRRKEILKLLVEREDLDVNVATADGDTILSIAARLVAILITRKDLSKSAVNKKGEKPSSVARWLGG